MITQALDHEPATGSVREPLARNSDSRTLPLDVTWRQHSSDLFARCLAWTGGRRDDAEEALSRAAIRSCRVFREGRQRPAHPRRWLLRLAHNVCMDLHRERKRRREVRFFPTGCRATGCSLDRGEDPEGSMLRKELSTLLGESIAALPDRLRETVLSHLSSASYREVAARLSISEANARKRMQQARQLLRRRLRDYRRSALETPPPSLGTGGDSQTSS